MKLRNYLRTLGLLVLASAASAVAQEKTPGAGNEATRPRPAVGARRVPQLADSQVSKIERDVTYGKVGDVELKLDIYHPKNGSAKSRPVAVYVHGGGWTQGSKASGAGMVALPELLQRGYLVASIDYRLAPEFKFPAQIEDAKCAVRFLRAHAKEYDLDPTRIGVFGGSAGGHLVALLGTADASAGFDTSGGWTNQSSRAQAVVDLFGPADLTLGVGGANPRLGENVFGAKSRDDEVLKRASPVTYATLDDPPFLILHGDQDRVVPLAQSERLLAVLKKSGVPATLVVVTNAGHSFAPAGGTPNPDRKEIGKIIADFFDKTLRK